MCDSVLDEIGLRQHEFDWLRGDVSETGRQVRLPVDGYWPKAIELAPLVGVKATAPLRDDECMGSILLIIWAASLLLLFFLAVRVIGARVMGLRLTDWPGLVACAAGILAVPSFLLDEHPTLLATIPLALAAGIWQALRTFSSWRRGETVAGYYVTVAPPERVANRWPLVPQLPGSGATEDYVEKQNGV